MWFRKRSDQDFAEEIEAHLELETDRLIATGMSPADARAAALRVFGNRTAARERFHESRGRVYLDQLLQDLRYAVRSMRRTPAFALVAIVCLAVGISVNTAAFSVLNAVLFRDYPGVVRQDELVGVRIGQDGRWGRSFPEYASTLDWEMLRSAVPAFSGVAAFTNLQLSARAGGEPQAVRGALVSNEYFDVLGTRPGRGRFMTDQDDPRDLKQVVVISYAWWQHRLAARPDVIGQVITIGTHSFAIIGVTPEGFFGLYPGEVVDPDVGAAELFIPLAAAPLLRVGMPTGSGAPAEVLEDRWLQVFGRLRPGATLADAQRDADVVAARLAAAYPEERKHAFAALRAGRSKDAAEIASAILFVMAVPVIILLVACANLANQLLARAIQRGREIGVRLSLGASRGRVVRQLLVEAGLLAVVASAIGVVLARWLLDGLRAWALPLPFHVPIDVHVLVFAIGLGLVTALAFGLVPALRATRTDLASALKDGAPGGYRRSRLRNALVVAQIAASLALLAVASVFVRAGQRPPSATLDALADRALLVSMNLDLTAFDSVTGRAYQQAVLDRLEHLPGVAAVGMAPFSMFEMLPGQFITRPGQDPSHPDFGHVAQISGGWFDATNTRPLRGRLFTAAERAAPPAVAVVDELFAREMWDTAEAIGQTLRIGSDAVPTVVTVVGVVPERREVAYRQPEGVLFIPGTKAYNPRTYLYVRTNGDAASLIAAVQQAIRGIDPRVPILWARTLENVAEQDAAPLAMLASGLASLGAVAYALAALGLFGVLSFLVAQRRNEIGIRVALGARRLDITWMVLRHALGLGAGGVVAGAVIALAAVTLLRAIIHGLQPLPLPAFAAMSLIMLVVALVASAVPARRAAAVDPMMALRAE